MKRITLLILLISSAAVYGQNSTKDSLIHEVDEYVKAVNKAADRFLNTKLSTDERIQAIEPYDIIYDPNQIAQFKKIVLDDKEQPDIRAMALDKIYQSAVDDDKLWALSTEWLGNPKAPKVLRQEAFQLVSNLSVSTMDVLDIYQKMLEDPELEFRLFAFTRLIAHGDARAQQKLIEGLENPQVALLPAATAIGVLSMSVKKEYYPALYKVLRETNDEATRLEVIRALGFYKEAREDLKSICLNPSEQEQFREAALGALYAGDRDNIVEYVLPILFDKNAALRLQIIAIQMTIDVRQAMAYRVKTKKADNYDLLMKRMAQDKTKPSDLREIAGKYMQSVRPNY